MNAGVGQLLTRSGLIVMIVILSGCLLLLGMSGHLRAAADQPGSPTRRLSETLPDRLERALIPGAAVVVVDQSGHADSIVSGIGRDGAPVGPTTPFVIGSTSKSFTALAILQLVDAGTVDLDAPVRTYVPELQLAAGEPVDRITVRHLLQQTSGLSDASGGPVLASAVEGTALDAVAEIAGSRLAGDPGEVWAYANVNYVLAGLVVERAAGMSYPDYVERQIFIPLGMTNSYTDSAKIPVGFQGTDVQGSGHRFWFGRAVGSEPLQRRGLLAAGYLISCADDLGRYLAMYLAGGVAADGTRVISEAGLAVMLAAGPQARLGPWANGQASHYAMGWFAGGPWSEAAILHAGDSPDSTAMIALLPERGIGVATLLNAGHELPVPGNPNLTDRVARSVVDGVLEAPTVELPSMRTFYLVFDLVAAAALVLALVDLARAVRQLLHRRRVSRLAGWLGVGARVVGGLLISLAPLLLYAGWRALWVWGPDLALLLTVMIALLLATAAVRVIALLRPPP